MSCSRCQKIRDKINKLVPGLLPPIPLKEPVKDDKKDRS